MPVITLLTGGVNFSAWKIQLSEGEAPSFLNYGNFITAVINFLLMALIIFCFVKFMNALSERMIKKPAEAAPAPTTKKCPYCLSEIPIKATKCAHCASDLPVEEKTE